jgi:serine/threonine protein kinase
LGKGGDGTVYLVENAKKEKYVVKRIDLICSKKAASKEIDFLSKDELLSDHLVRYYKNISEDENNYENIVMEYCENGDLENYIQTHKCFTEKVLFYFNYLIIFFF